MLGKLFLLGPPGCGKSTAFRNIRTYVQGRHVERINDFEILKYMFDADYQHQRFHPTRKHGGFIVKDFSVFDEALQEANRRILIEEERLLESTDQLLLIEFSRNDYRKALQHFDLIILQDAYFLLLSANKKICQKRLEERVTDPPTEDNHFVSRTILRDYYNQALPYLPSDLAVDYHIDPTRVKSINNSGSLDDFEAQVRRFVDAILKQETQIVHQLEASAARIRLASNTR